MMDKTVKEILERMVEFASVEFIESELRFMEFQNNDEAAQILRDGLKKRSE